MHPARTDDHVKLEVSSQAPRSELGRAIGYGMRGWIEPWSAWIDEREWVPDLVWPKSISIFDKMRTDAQLKALFYAVTMPIRRYKWLIDPNGAPEVMARAIADDFNLDIVGQEPRPRKRRQGRFGHDRHLYHSLLALIYGHMCFEQVGYIGDAKNPPADGLWHLSKLAPRMPWDISVINVAEDGGLVSIKQPYTRSSGKMLYEPIEIPIDRLIWFAWDKEGANWVGRSIFRDCWRNWLIKDRLLRVDAINHERAGGVPWIEAPPGATPAELQKLSEMAQSFKVGEESGGSVPKGGALNIAKLGSGTDVIASIKYHDEAMARSFLAMFMQLGQTQTGSRALGESFIDYLYLAQIAVANWYCDIMNEFMIEDYIDWNWGENIDTVPQLVYAVEAEEEYIAISDLVALIQAHAIQVDTDLEDSLRRRYRLPQRGGELIVPPAPAPAPNQVALAGEFQRHMTTDRYVQLQMEAMG